MARKRPTRMLPPSQCPKPLGSDETDYAANSKIVEDMLGGWGEDIHSFYVSAHARGMGDDNPPLVVLVHPECYSGSMGKLAREIASGTTGLDGVGFTGMTRSDFEGLLAKSHLSMLDDVRGQLDECICRQDGPPVAVILPGHLFVATCIDKTQAN